MIESNILKTKGVPLVIESHHENYDGAPYFTLIQYNNDLHLVLIDNCDAKNIYAYRLDILSTVNIDEGIVIRTIDEWFRNNSENYPISIEFSKRGLSNQLSEIYTTFPINFISRLIGPVFHFPMRDVYKYSRRRK